MAKPEKKGQLKKWYVHCTECAGGYVESKDKPTECPNNPAHIIGKVEKYGAYPQGFTLSSPDGSLWMVCVEDNGQLRTEKL